MKKTKVTIGIPTYNEEQNIEIILRSLFAQKLETIDIEKILVYSDASSDRTDSIVTKLSKIYPKIKLLKDNVRKGKYFRVNELFKINTSEVLVIIDADIAFAQEVFLETLVNALITDKKAVMTSAHVRLIRAQKFLPKLIHTSFVLGDFVRLNVPNYNVSANFHGTATAYKDSFIKTIDIPTNLLDPHFFIYLSARKISGFRYCTQAIILQVPPSTIADVAKLMQRSIGKYDAELEKIFGKEMLKEASFVSKKSKIIGVLQCFMWQPFYTPLAIVMNMYIRRLAKTVKIDKSPIWEVNVSTKKPISYAK
ncbi:MAG TPA: glycosyltransferase family A protein [Candidatus Saccharimonadales bacterium]|nr:glycosyltransferase family A protein [Candidatus Saccharimonadales bacterium]